MFEFDTDIDMWFAFYPVVALLFRFQKNRASPGIMIKGVTPELFQRPQDSAPSTFADDCVVCGTYVGFFKRDESRPTRVYIEEWT